MKVYSDERAVLLCEECDEFVTETVEFRAAFTWTVELCRPCLIKALAMLEDHKEAVRS